MIRATTQPITSSDFTAPHGLNASSTAPHLVGRHEVILAAIEHGQHLLPSQGPISVFVHHNTLHPFEDVPFDEAVIQGQSIYGCQPYLSEARYRDELRRGRISLDDLRQVLMDDLGESADELIATFGTRYRLRLTMLQVTMLAAPGAELQWLMAETDLLKRFRADTPPTQRDQIIQRTKSWVMRQNATTSDASAASAFVKNVLADQPRNTSMDSWTTAQWEAFTLRLMWTCCQSGIERSTAPMASTRASDRHVDLIRAASHSSIRSDIDSVLIRFCGAFLDQGLAGWKLPYRDEGFAVAFAKLFLKRFTVEFDWMRAMRSELQAIADGTRSTIDSLTDSLAALGLADEEIPHAIESQMLALRGWAGMIWQMESSTPWLPYPAPPGSLLAYVAIRFLMLKHAISSLGQQRFGTSDPAEAALRLSLPASPLSPAMNRQRMIAERTYQLFQLAQAGGWSPEQLLELSPHQWTSLLVEFDSFSAIERRRIWHAAYERHYRVAAENAIVAHWRKRGVDGDRRPANTDYLTVFCIDDREESFRRHLEEIDARCETAAAAGFFAVAMYYRGAEHAHYRPLCPNIVVPKHFVREEPVFSSVEASERRAERRRHLGQLSHQVHLRSRTMLGGWATGLLGAVATVPLVARILAPRLTAQLRESMGTWVRPPATELHLERIAPEPGPTDDAMGYNLDEMAGIVVRILQDIGKVEKFPPLVIFFGHGSSSLNNPHESAYNCGACSGGRGGPNARAFAMMANDIRVRKRIADLGIFIPDDVRFLGGYHNTCNDRIEFFDLDLLPRTHRDLFRRVETNINAARARNAFERSRRFESAPLSLSPAAALEHVEQRAEDLSQARPEYNHATNALVLVGRRDWSRGLFLDRRAFVTSYDPTVDDQQGTILTRILQAVVPVCGGISLEYYFSTVDPEGYGCGSKLPHNVASMIGVMTGAASDLRPGLSQQMVEIHEPMRILFVVETSPTMMQSIIAANPGIARMVHGQWVQLSVFDPESLQLHQYLKGEFVGVTVSKDDLPEVASSIDWVRGQRDHLGFASIATPTTVTGASS